MLVAFGVLCVLVVIAMHVARRKRTIPGVPVGEEYERLSRAYRGTCIPYKLYAVVGKTAPPEEESRFRGAQNALADFVLGLEGDRFAALAMHLDAAARKYDGPAPFDHVCEFIHEEQERIRRDRREVDGFGFRFAMGFIPAPAPLYFPYRPGRALPAATAVARA